MRKRSESGLLVVAFEILASAGPAWGDGRLEARSILHEAAQAAAMIQDPLLRDAVLSRAGRPF